MGSILTVKQHETRLAHGKSRDDGMIVAIGAHRNDGGEVILGMAESTNMKTMHGDKWDQILTVKRKYNSKAISSMRMDQNRCGSNW